MALKPKISSDELQVRQILTEFVCSGSSKNIDALKTLLKNFLDSKKKEILQDYEKSDAPDSYTIFHLAARRDDCDIIRVLLSSFESGHRLPILKKYKTTPLHTAAKYGCSNSLDAILSQLYLKEDHIKLVASQYLDKTHWADVRVKRSTFELCEIPNQHVELISAQDGEGQTALHKAASAEHVVMPVASGYLTCDQNLTAVSIQDDHDGRNHQTFWADARVKRSSIHDELSSKKSIKQQTALHKVVCTHAINAILMYLTPDQQLSAISIYRSQGLNSSSSGC